MSLYNDLANIDIISPIVGRRAINLTSDGRPVVFVGRSLDPNATWLGYKINEDRQCDLWFDNYFRLYNFIPKACRSCWKVVMKIENLRQLMRLKDKQQGSEYNCKCGLENRPWSGNIGGYRAFWYGNLDEGLKGGRELYKYVQKQFPGVKIDLKRGCTEMELKYNPSDTWDEWAGKGNWDFIEELCNTLFVLEDVKLGSTPEVLKPRIVKNWIDFAFEHGDLTYLDFTDGKPFPESMHYQSSIHNDRDYIGSRYEPLKVKGHFNYAIDNNRPTDAQERGTGEREAKSKLTLVT